jgi:hypothetical protein
MSVIRRIEASDVPQLFRVRAGTDENRLTLDQLAALGISFSFFTDMSPLELWDNRLGRGGMVTLIAPN